MSSQASLFNLNMAVKSALIYLCRFGGPVLIFIGNVGCILNLMVFTQKHLRKNPCSFYFIGYNITSFLYIYSALLSATMNTGYNINPGAYSLLICRLNLYASLLLHCLGQFYLILASIDRILVTSRNALTRRRSSRRLACICIVIGTIFWALFHSHILILTNIIQIAPNYFICSFGQGVQAAFVSYYTIIKETLVLSLMIICGLWSINNIRGARRVRVVPDETTRRIAGEGGRHSASVKDRQLVIMLVVDITTYALFSFVLGIFFIYQQITQNYVKSPDQVQLETSIRTICYFSITIPCCISCYANLLVSKAYRNEVKKVLLCR